jgi:hypothetical protein
MELPAIVGIVAGASVLNNLISSAGKGDVDTCVNAYYADKYNGDRVGTPSKTFLACMQTRFPETFKETKAKYQPAAARTEGPQ